MPETDALILYRFFLPLRFSSLAGCGANNKMNPNIFFIFHSRQCSLQDRTLSLHQRLVLDIQKDYFNIAGIVVTEHLRAALDASHAEGACANINIRFFHNFASFLEKISGYGGITCGILFAHP
jgi:hypothetical protein